MSSLSANARDVYSEFNLMNQIGEFIDQNEFNVTEYNDILIDDIITNYYYNRLQESAEFTPENIYSFLMSKIRKSIFKSISAVTIIHWLYNDNKITYSDLKYLKSKFSNF